MRFFLEVIKFESSRIIALRWIRNFLVRWIRVEFFKLLGMCSWEWHLFGSKTLDKVERLSKVKWGWCINLSYRRGILLISELILKNNWETSLIDWIKSITSVTLHSLSFQIVLFFFLSLFGLFYYIWKWIKNFVLCKHYIALYENTVWKWWLTVVFPTVYA